MNSFKTIAIVDYSHFTKERKYYGSMEELMDILVGKKLEVYALLPKDFKEDMPPIDMDTKGIIPFVEDDLYSKELIDDIMNITKCSDFSKMFVISLNPMVLNYFEQNNLEVYRINNGYNDVASSNALELKHVKKLRRILT